MMIIIEVFLPLLIYIFCVSGCAHVQYIHLCTQTAPFYYSNLMITCSAFVSTVLCQLWGRVPETKFEHCSGDDTKSRYFQALAAVLSAMIGWACNFTSQQKPLQQIQKSTSLCCVWPAFKAFTWNIICRKDASAAQVVKLMSLKYWCHGGLSTGTPME